MKNEKDMIKWINNLKIDIGQPQLPQLWHYVEILDVIAKYLESTERTGGWIPVSEKLPSKSGQYLVFYEGTGIGSWIEIMWYGKPSMPNVDVGGKHFYKSDSAWGDIIYDDIIAWMPLPEPYKGGDDNELQHSEAERTKEAIDMTREEDNAYWVTYNETSHEKGMTLTGINQALNECPPVEPERPNRTETMMVDGEPTEIDPLSYEVGYSHGQSERPKGKWIEYIDDMNGGRSVRWYTCDQCGRSGDIGDDFCRRCGADMRGDKE